MEKLTRVYRMSITAAVSAIILAAASGARVNGEYVPDDPLTSPRTEWWREGKFGMFIHWGVYAVPAKGEWYMHNAKIPIEEYEKYPPQFKPTEFNAREWARLARQAGMTYMVITSKHHDGFSMYDTSVNDYSIVKATPYGRDPMKDLARACKEEGIRFGFYYSILDWHHPDANAEGLERYLPQMKRQIRELIDGYDPAVLWFDGQWPSWWTAALGDDLEAYVRSLKPSIIINNRVGKGTN
jgi:alpha-L-fucosidase